MAGESNADDRPATVQLVPQAVATGLWIARSTFEETRFSVLELCADGTLGHGSPNEPLPLAGVATCAVPSGRFRSSGTMVVLDDGSAHHEARLAADTLVVADSGDVYYRAAPATTVEGTYRMRNALGDAGDDDVVTITRHVRFDSERFRFDNELARSGTDDRWTTFEEGSYDVVRPGMIEMFANGATRCAHVVTFGPRGAYLHIEGVGYLPRQ